MKNPSWRVNTKRTLHDEIVAFCRLTAPTKQELQKREEAGQRLRDYVQVNVAQSSDDGCDGCCDSLNGQELQLRSMAHMSLGLASSARVHGLSIRMAWVLTGGHWLQISTQW